MERDFIICSLVITIGSCTSRGETVSAASLLWPRRVIIQKEESRERGGWIESMSPWSTGSGRLEGRNGASRSEGTPEWLRTRGQMASHVLSLD